MRSISRAHHERAQLVTEAQRPLSQDIAYRQRRYLIMMGIRVACFLAAVVLFAEGAGWIAGIPAVGAIVIPYFAVVFANGGREPASTRGFRAYEPHLPMPRAPGPGPAGPGSTSPHPTSADAPRTGTPQPAGEAVQQRAPHSSRQSGPENRPGNG